MDGADLCFEIVKRANLGFVYSEAVARYVHVMFCCICLTICQELRSIYMFSFPVLSEM